jgi:hypothetical protein
MTSQKSVAGFEHGLCTSENGIYRKESTAKLSFTKLVWSKIKTVGKTGVIPSLRSLAACRPLHFFGAINGALCARRWCPWEWMQASALGH